MIQREFGSLGRWSLAVPGDDRPASGANSHQVLSPARTPTREREPLSIATSMTSEVIGGSKGDEDQLFISLARRCNTLAQVPECWLVGGSETDLNSCAHDLALSSEVEYIERRRLLDKQRKQRR
jgi:hypothetical protein